MIIKNDWIYELYIKEIILNKLNINTPFNGGVFSVKNITQMDKKTNFKFKKNLDNLENFLNLIEERLSKGDNKETINNEIENELNKFITNNNLSNNAKTSN